MKMRERLSKLLTNWENLFAQMRQSTRKLRAFQETVVKWWGNALNTNRNTWISLRTSAKRGISNLLKNLDHPIFYSLTVTALVLLIYGEFYPKLQNSSLFIYNSETAQKSIEWVGVLYSLLISMILIRAWERLENTGKLLAQEAYTLAQLFDSVCTIPEMLSPDAVPDLQKVKSLIRDYVYYVEEQYDAEYRDSTKELIGSKKIDAIKQETEILSNANPAIVAVNLPEKLGDLLVARRIRLHNSKVRMPFPISVLLYVSSIFWLGLFASVKFDNIPLTYIFIGCITFIVLTITNSVVFFYEPINIKLNDISGSWKELKSKLYNMP